MFYFNYPNCFQICSSVARQVFFFLIGIQLIYNVLVSGIQQSESVIYVHVSTLFKILFPQRTLQSVEQSSLAIQQTLFKVVFVLATKFGSNLFCSNRQPQQLVVSLCGQFTGLLKLYHQVSCQNFRSSYRVSFSFFCSSSFPLTLFFSVLIISHCPTDLSAFSVSSERVFVY